MNRTTFISALISIGLLVAPASSYAAMVSPAQPAAPADTFQSLSSALAAVASSVNTLASSTASMTIASGQSAIGLDGRTGGELKITNVGSYHTDSPAYSFAPSIHLSKLIFQYIPCTAASPAVCNTNANYPPVTSELALNGSTNYLNYMIQLTALSSTSATVEVTDTTEFTNIQNELTSISVRIHALLGTK